MIQNYSTLLCTECKEAIYNPICPLCLANEIKEWLRENKLRIIVGKKIDEFISKNSLAIGSSNVCIICKKENSFACPYCFTEFMFNCLKRMKASKKVQREFLEFFNYDFEHTGYSEDAEELGLL